MMFMLYLFRNLRGYILVLLLLPIVGALGYWVIGQGQWSLFDCLYMTVISITTVGYGETINIENHHLARWFTMFLILSSNMCLGIILAKLGSVIIAGELDDYKGKLKMEKKIENFQDHYIVVGTNPISRNIMRELQATKQDFVAVDTEMERFENMKTYFPDLVYHCPQSINEGVLKHLKIHKAAGFITAHPDERENLFLTLTARSMNPKLRIVSMCVNDEVATKLKQVGADAVVRPDMIGGLRMASELLRPSVVTFLDRMLRDSQKGLRFEEVTVDGTSPFISKQLQDLDIQKKTGLIVVALDHESSIVYNPSPEHVVEAGMNIIVIGKPEQVSQLDSYVNKRPAAIAV